MKKTLLPIIIFTTFLLLNCSLFAQCDSCTVRVTGGSNPLCDSTQLDWATWGAVSTTTAAGTISNNITINVTMSTGGLSTTPAMFNGTVFPPQYNVPINSTAISNSLAGIFTFCFSQPVRDPQIAFASIGNPSTSVPIITSSCYQIIWAGQGMTYPNDTTMVGTEGFTIIKFPGTHTCLSFNYLTSEYYCNLAFGILDTNCQTILPPPFCSGDSLHDTLIAAGAASYFWTPATGLNTTTGAIVIANPTVTTTYYVTGTCSNGGTSTDSITVPVYGLPNAAITGSDSICSGGTATLNTGVSSTYNWSTGATTQSINITATGNYYVTVTNGNGCSSRDSIHIHQYTLPPPTITGPDSFCSSASGILNAGIYAAYIWSNGATTQNNNVTTAGTYIVTVTDANGCSATASKTVNTLPSAQASFTADSLIGCDSVTVHFTNTSGSATGYYWDFGDGTNGTSISPNHTYHTSGTIGVYLVGYSANGCNDTAFHILTLSIVSPTVTSSFVADTLHGCSPFVVHFTNTSNNGTAYYWDFGDHTNSTSTSPSHTYNDSGIYTVTLITYNTSAPCPMIADSMKIQNYIRVDTTLNTVSDFIGSPQEGCSPLVVNFTNKSSNSSIYIWNFGDGWSDTTMNPSHIFFDSGSYVITLLSYNNSNRCGINNDSLKLIVHVDSCEIYFPNVFSPNDDGRNDFFNMIAFGFSNYHLLIYNRWGLKVFESNDGQVLWNGKISNTGSQCPDGTYYYIFTGNDMSDRPYNQHGFLTLIR